MFTLLHQGYVRHVANWNFGPICSCFTRIYYVSEGAATVVIGQQTHQLRAGYLYMIPAFTSHYDRCQQSFCHQYIHFMPTINYGDKRKGVSSVLPFEEDLLSQYELPFEVEATPADIAIFKRLNEIQPNASLPTPNPSVYEETAPLAKVMCRHHALPISMRVEIDGLLLQLLSRFLTKARQRYSVDDNRIAHALQVIAHACDSLCSMPSVQELADEVSLCKDAFIRLFRRQTGYTPTDFIIRHRIIRAQNILTQSSCNIKNVALQLGYENVNYFSRVFKRVTGVSPKEFVRQNRKDLNLYRNTVIKDMDDSYPI